MVLSKHSLILSALMFAFSGAFTGEAKDAPVAEMPKAHFEFFSNYCLDCHDDLSEKGEVNLDALSFQLNTHEAAETWQKVLNVMNSGEMPPEDKTQPKADEKTEFLDDLSHELVKARKILSDSGGVITMRRLNRREYENTIEDLLGVAIDAEGLPRDSSPGTYDTVGSGLFFSSDQFEQYLEIARHTLKSALLNEEQAKPIVIHQESEIQANKSVKFQVGRYTENNDRALAWLASDNRAEFEDGFTDERQANIWINRYNERVPAYEYYQAQPETKSGALFVGFFDGFLSDSITVPEDAPPGDYLVRARVGKLDGISDKRQYLEIGVISERGRTAEMSVLDHRKVKGSYDAPEVIEFKITVTPTSSRKVVLRERAHNSRVAVREIVREVKDPDDLVYPAALWVDWLELEGPVIDSKKATLSESIYGESDFTEPTDATAREIIERFATRAFRIVEPEEALVNKLLALYRDRRAAGEDFKKALIEPLAVVLASPQFLYLSEPKLDSEKRELTDLELAVRLSYFLWSSSPDEQLYAVAREGKLKDPETLTGEVDRMLSDPKAMKFVSGFTEQWLHMDRLDFFQFNSELYPDFDDSGKNSARDEVYYTLKTLLDENLNVGYLLKSDFVVIDDLLADYYGIDGVEGDHFRKVSLPADSPRGGLLGTAAVLAMGSDGERSSPVERGVWIMKSLLHAPSPPAPANVPQLSRLAVKPLSARELQRAHQEQPQCAQCHRKIDPLGFGLENFDAAGKWRTEERIAATKKGRKDTFAPINPAGTMLDKTPFNDYFEMRDLIANQEEAFARGLTEALIAYGLGRPYGFTDFDLAEEILREAKAENYDARSFIHALTQSKPFQQK